MNKCDYKVNNNGNLRYITINKLEELGFVKHFISCKPMDVNIEFGKEYVNEIIRNENMNLQNSVSLKQIHSDIFYEVSNENKGDVLNKEGDALITSTSGMPIGVYTADCVPVILIDSKQKIISVVHAGWKGTEKKIVKKTLEYMLESKNSNVSDIIAIIGPHIGKCCYEVGIEVADKFEYKSVKGNSYYLDLGMENYEQIESLGVEDNNIFTLSLCTYCNNDLLHSYRKDGHLCGRIATYIEII